LLKFKKKILFFRISTHLFDGIFPFVTILATHHSNLNKIIDYIDHISKITANANKMERFFFKDSLQIKKFSHFDRKKWCYFRHPPEGSRK
jgi:hypothetical protein